MEFWENLSAGTKGAVIIGAILLVVILVVRAMQPADGPPLELGIRPGAAQPR